MPRPTGQMRPRWPAPPPDGWCHEHHRPVGPDNLCPLCVQGEAPARSERRMVLVVLAIALVGGIGPAAYYFFWARHAEQRRATANATQKAKRDAKTRRTLVAAQDRWVDVVKPSTGMAEVEKVHSRTTRRTNQTGRRAERRHRRGGSHARPPRATTPRPKARVPITMYMAHW